MNLHHEFTKTWEASRGKMWPGKTKAVNDFILSCSCCKEKYNRMTSTLSRIFGYIPDARYLLEIVLIHLFEFGNRYFLTIITACPWIQSLEKLYEEPWGAGLKNSESQEVSFPGWKFITK
jgi:hypothetical protein